MQRLGELLTPRSLQYQSKDIAKARMRVQEDGSYPEYLERVQAAVLEEFRAPGIPVARINYLTIYQASVQAMDLISKANHEEDPGCICRCPAELCLRECDAVLKHRLAASSRRASVAIEESASKSCLEHLMAVFGGKSTDDFLWDV